jgi:hypothetical protein
MAMKPAHVGICKNDVSTYENLPIGSTYLLLIDEVLDIVVDDGWVDHVCRTRLERRVVRVTLARTVTQPKIRVLSEVKTIQESVDR